MAIEPVTDKAKQRDNARRVRANIARNAHCSFAPLEPGDDLPRRRVVMPNGVVIFSTWYKVPRTDADSRLAYRENRWLLDVYPGLMRARETLKDAARTAEELARLAAREFERLYEEHTATHGVIVS